jgi:glycosyltransferase involved in cell wall biosynthesis
VTAAAEHSSSRQGLKLTYLTVDSLAEGVGASQVTPYLAELRRAGWDVEVHSFERSVVSADVAARVADLGITWQPHRFGLGGPAGGVRRLLRGMAAVRGAQLVHARGTLPAGSALLAKPTHWVWDMRGLWTDARIAAGRITPGSPTERALRRLERRVAIGAAAIVTLSERARDVLANEYGADVAVKVEVIPTCVDLDRFPIQAMPPRPPLRLGLSGTFGSRYDLNVVAELATALSLSGPVELAAATPPHSPRLDELRQVGADIRHPAHADIPLTLSRMHVGLCILRPSRADAASMPTKVGEFLATGRPVVVSREVGDLDDLLRRHRAGVIFDERARDGVNAAASQLLALLEDPELSRRCRGLAESHFDVRQGSVRLDRLYRRVLERVR